MSALSRSVALSLTVSIILVSCTRGNTDGRFTMGQRKDTVTVKPFLMDVTEVTADAYAACVRAGGCTAEGLHCNPLATYGVNGKGNHPINCVDWNQATAYCQWAGSRLPTEEEWEWMARGQSQGTTYPWGNDAPGSQLCWNRAKQGTCAVGSYPAGDAPGGIHDLAGNVWEWTASNFDAAASSRVMRGGSFDTADAWGLLASYRNGYAPTVRLYDLGFRCSRTR